MFRGSLLFLSLSLGACATGGGSFDRALDASADAEGDARVGPLELDAAKDAQMDGAPAEEDAAPSEDAAIDATKDDAGVVDGGAVDAEDAALDAADALDGAEAPDGSLPDAPVDTGPPPIVGPTIDGVITAGEWSDAATLMNSTASNWGANALTRLSALVADDSLYVAFEGALEPSSGNAIVVYVDADYGGARGVASLFELSDGTGALDDAISAGITTNAELRVDFAMGTKDFGRAADPFDARMGWRDVSRVADFAWMDASASPFVCGSSACETQISFATLGGEGPFALFARLVNRDGSVLSNQCLPSDATPTVVSAPLVVTP